VPSLFNSTSVAWSDNLRISVASILPPLQLAVWALHPTHPASA
jgi:hypothetical protein